MGRADLNLSVGGDLTPLIKDIERLTKKKHSLNFQTKGNLAQPLGRITGQLGEFEKSLEASNARVLAFSASAGALYAFQRGVEAIFSSAVDLEKQLADINVILNVSSKNLNKFGNELFSVAKNTAQSFGAVSAAATELARQGLSVTETLKRTNDALILTRLSGMDAVSAVESLTAALNSFSRAAMDSTTFVSKLAAVDAAFAVSSADLAEAIKRVGSSAQEAGLGIDELIAAVTAAQHITARGGAVIGNSFKTIFTRIQRPRVLKALEEIGVKTTDLTGKVRPAMQVMQDLANTFDVLTDAQKSTITQLVGGVFQVNVLKASLRDLNKEFSLYNNALGISATATDEAIRRNEELNKTVSATLNRTVENLRKTAAEMGGLTLAPVTKKLASSLNKALENFDIGEGIGGKLAEGILGGMGKFFSGGGLALAGVTLFRVFQRLVTQVGDAFRTLTGIGKISENELLLQKQITGTLASNPAILKKIANGSLTVSQVHKTLLDQIELENKALLLQKRIAEQIAAALHKSGVTVGNTFGELVPPGGSPSVVDHPLMASSRKGHIPKKSKGHIPNFNKRDKEAKRQELAGASYAKSGTRAVIDRMSGLGKYVRNTAEEKISGKVTGHKQDWINPPKSSPEGKDHRKNAIKQTGIDPYALRKGMVTNFAKIVDKDHLGGVQYDLVMKYALKKGHPIINVAGPGGSGKNYFAENLVSKERSRTKGQRAKGWLHRGKEAAASVAGKMGAYGVERKLRGHHSYAIKGGSYVESDDRFFAGAHKGAAKTGGVGGKPVSPKTMLAKFQKSAKEDENWSPGGVGSTESLIFLHSTEGMISKRAELFKRAQSNYIIARDKKQVEKLREKRRESGMGSMNRSEDQSSNVGTRSYKLLEEKMNEIGVGETISYVKNTGFIPNFASKSGVSITGDNAPVFTAGGMTLVREGRQSWGHGHFDFNYKGQNIGRWEGDAIKDYENTEKKALQSSNVYGTEGVGKKLKAWGFKSPKDDLARLLAEGYNEIRQETKTSYSGIFGDTTVSPFGAKIQASLATMFPGRFKRTEDLVNPPKGYPRTVFRSGGVVPNFYNEIEGHDPNHGMAFELFVDDKKVDINKPPTNQNLLAHVDKMRRNPRNKGKKWQIKTAMTRMGKNGPEPQPGGGMLSSDGIMSEGFIPNFFNMENKKYRDGLEQEITSHDKKGKRVGQLTYDETKSALELTYNASSAKGAGFKQFQGLMQESVATGKPITSGSLINQVAYLGTKLTTLSKLSPFEQMSRFAFPQLRHRQVPGAKTSGQGQFLLAGVGGKDQPTFEFKTLRDLKSKSNQWNKEVFAKGLIKNAVSINHLKTTAGNKTGLFKRDDSKLLASGLVPNFALPEPRDHIAGYIPEPSSLDNLKAADLIRLTGRRPNWHRKSKLGRGPMTDYQRLFTLLGDGSGWRYEPTGEIYSEAGAINHAKSLGLMAKGFVPNFLQANVSGITPFADVVQMYSPEWKWQPKEDGKIRVPSREDQNRFEGLLKLLNGDPWNSPHGLVQGQGAKNYGQRPLAMDLYNNATGRRQTTKMLGDDKGGPNGLALPDSWINWFASDKEGHRLWRAIGPMKQSNKPVFPPNVPQPTLAQQVINNSKSGNTAGTKGQAMEEIMQAILASSGGHRAANMAPIDFPQINKIKGQPWAKALGLFNPTAVDMYAHGDAHVSGGHGTPEMLGKIARAHAGSQKLGGPGENEGPIPFDNWKQVLEWKKGPGQPGATGSINLTLQGKKIYKKSMMSEGDILREIGKTNMDRETVLELFGNQGVQLENEFQASNHKSWHSDRKIEIGARKEQLNFQGQEIAGRPHTATPSPGLNYPKGAPNVPSIGKLGGTAGDTVSKINLDKWGIADVYADIVQSGTDSHKKYSSTVSSIIDKAPSLLTNLKGMLDAGIVSPSTKVEGSYAKDLIDWAPLKGQQLAYDTGKGPTQTTGKYKNSPLEILEALWAGKGGAKGKLLNDALTTGNIGLSGANRGFIPNFADPLKEAISRESAAGIPKSQIRVESSPKLRSAANPAGLGVTNTRDEPMGINQGIRRAQGMGINPKTHGLAAAGFIPNFRKIKGKKHRDLMRDVTAGLSGGDAGQIGAAFNKIADALEKGDKEGAQKLSQELVEMAKNAGASDALMDKIKGGVNRIHGHSSKLEKARLDEAKAAEEAAELAKKQARESWFGGEESK